MSLDLTRESFRVSIECAHGHVALELFQPIGGFTDDERGLSLTSFASGLRGSSQVEWVISDEPNGHKWSFGRGGFYLARESVSLDVQRWLVLPSVVCRPASWIAVNPPKIRTTAEKKSLPRLFIQSHGQHQRRVSGMRNGD